MASYIDKAISNQPQRKQSERRRTSASSYASQQVYPTDSTSAKHHRISKAKVQKPSRRSPRLSVALHELPQQHASATRPTETQFASIDYWRREGYWPKEPKQTLKPDTMSHLLVRKGSTRSLRRKRSESDSLVASSTTPSDQKPREEKSAPYQNPRYKTLLETKGSYMDKSPLDITDEGKRLCRTLLEKTQVTPNNSLFQDHLFDRACRKLQDRNEARVVQDIARLIVPSAETLATFGAEELEILVESVNEGWNNAVPLTGTRPQPDYSVGFKREAFSSEQRDKLAPSLGDFITGDQSYFMATCYMYFPFLTCEVKCGAAALDVADRQNAHSMTLAVRAVVELFRLVKREKELNREILAFSVSHDHRSVRLYGHYAVVNGPDTTFYRHPIHEFSFTALDGKEKWTAHNFIRSVYDTSMPTHLRRLCSAADDLPCGVNFDVPPLLQDCGLSQEPGSYHHSGSFLRSVSQAGDDQSHSDNGILTPNASFTQKEPSKKKRGKMKFTSLNGTCSGSNIFSYVSSYCMFQKPRVYPVNPCPGENPSHSI
ncbi:hypothetical protein EJ07DRAFT_128592 [Lizonia empirigonia]|nr:hypothetical protein EJ07DRAFT_128592 [Lizonia empirigonia]